VFYTWPSLSIVKPIQKSLRNLPEKITRIGSSAFYLIESPKSNFFSLTASLINIKNLAPDMRRILTLLLLLFTLEARVSVLIPCHPAHFPLLEELLNAYAKQTEAPEEVVVSLSECDQVDPSLITALEAEPWPFQLILLEHPQKCSAGTNRNLAAQASSGDLLICQDADDLPHPQRVEIVKHIFAHHPIHLLIHSYLPMGKPFPQYNEESVVLHLLTQQILTSGLPNGLGGYIPIHHGNVCLSRRLAKLVAWDPTFMGGEDLSFNSRAWHFYRRQCFATSLQLILFRTHLSYFSNTPPHLR